MSSIKHNISVSPQDVFNISTTTQGTDLGAYATTGDGRVFRYVKVGGANLVPGTVVQAPVEVTANENLTLVAASAGAKTLTFADSLTVAANALTGGYVATTTGAGYGYQYKIAGNAACTAGSLTVTLEDPIVVALTTASRADVIASQFNGVIVNPTTQTGTPLGVAVAAIPSASFGWIQSHGPANVTASGALTVGLGVATSSATAGNVVLATSAVTNPVIGIAVTGVAANESGLVFLELD